MDAIDKINVFLAQKGMSGADLERAIGVSNSVYSQWNTKLTKPSKKSLLKVAEALDVDVSEIMPDKIEQKEKPTTENGSELSKERIQMLLDKMSAADLVELMGDITDILKRRNEQ